MLDLTRVLAGPWCTQNLADLGAEVIKIERPGAGDDTRAWGPPYLKDAAGNDTTEAAYYLSANRNKLSVALDIATPRGRSWCASWRSNATSWSRTSRSAACASTGWTTKASRPSTRA